MGISDGALMLVMHALDADRHGNVYGNYVEPDEGSGASEAGEDAALQAARVWLTRACRR